MFFLTITKINEVVFQGLVKSVSCPGSEGDLVILPNHIPLITPLKKGVLIVRLEDEDKELEFEIEKGLLEVSKSEVVILL